ncbi:MAG: TRL domain-containing protein, partial [Planctomycetota bacterium]
SKVGESMAEGIILLGRGDASISKAMKDGGITRIHHVDSEELNILGIYCKQIIRVYGE